MTRTSVAPALRPWGLSHLPAALSTLAVLAVIGTPLVWLIRGQSAGVSALGGLVLVAAFFTLSSAAVAWADRIAPAITLPIALSTYAGKVIVLAIVLAGLQDTSVDLPAFAAASLVGVFGWLGALLVPVVLTGGRRS